MDYNYNIILTISIKKKLQNITKKLGYSIWLSVYGKIHGIIDPNDHSSIEVVNKTLDEKYFYKIFKMKNCRMYTDTVNDTAFILNNKIVDGASFQFRNPKNSEVSNNIVFQKGTPKLKKKLKGTVFSLLTGGGGNANYWHWLFDVLPRIKILENEINLQNIDYFLLPDIKERFQKETLDLLNIPLEKRISSKKFRHIECDMMIAVDHPYVIKNNPSIEIQNLPDWILQYLRSKFLNKNVIKNSPEKFYIDRKDAKSNHRHLRKILNEKEVKKFLIKKDFSIKALSDFSFLDQINIFYNSSQIVGLHGAGFANLIFCKANTLVVELKSSTAGPVIGNLAKKMNLNYREISIQPPNHSSNNQQGLITIPLNLLEKKLS